MLDFPDARAAKTGYVEEVTSEIRPKAFGAGRIVAKPARQGATGPRRDTMSKKIRLLFVDDEEDFTIYMAKRLQKRDLEVDSFTDPLQALEQTEGKEYDVALLDLKMPGIDGEELLRRLKERDPRMEVIVLTGHGTVQSAASASRSGANEYLLKPCDFDELVAAITNAYSKRLRSVRTDRAEELDKLLANVVGLSPLELLDRLRKLDR